MDLNILNTQNLSSVAGAEFDCACGNFHCVQTKKIRFGAGAVSGLEAFMASLAPPLAAVAVVSDGFVRDATNRFFEKNLSRLGYRVFPRTFPSPLKATLDNAFSITVPEDAKLVLGIGGGTLADLTKYAAASNNLPCAFILTAPAALGVLSPSAMLEAGGLEETFKTPPFSAVLCDTDFLAKPPAGLVPAAFGELVSKAVSLFDYKFAHLVNGEKFCPYIYEQAAAVIDETIAKFTSGPVAAAEAKLAESSLRYSALSQAAGNSRLYGGGEVQAAHAVNLLFAHESRPARFRGETELVCARIVSGVYRNMLENKRGFFLPPPDNNMRLSRAREFLGAGELSLIRKIRPIPDQNKAKLQAYRYHEYRDELIVEADLAASRLNRAWKIFKRLYPDDGYSLLGYVEPSDAALCIALAPDLKEKFTLLSYMKDAGFLDGYLKDLE